jgi:hypothetical protein
MVSNLTVEATALRHAEPCDLRAVIRMTWRPTDARICRNEHVIRAHIYASIGILTHALSALPAITVRPFPSFW